MQNLCFGLEYTVSGCESCEASILLHLIQNDVWECFGAFRKPSTGKKCKACVSVLNTLFQGTEVVNHPFYFIRPKLIFGSVSEHFANLRQVTRCQTCVLSSNALFRVPMLWNISIGPKMMFGSVSEHFANLQQVTRCKTCVPSLNTLFRGIEDVKHPFYSIGPKMMFGSVSEHFANLRQVKRCKTCVSGLNTLFRGAEVVKHPFYSIWPKMMFGSVSEHFANLRQVKKDAKLVFRAWIHCFEVPKLWSIHSTPLDPNWFLAVFQSISLAFDR
jgi:hypothetical protein